MNINIGDVFYIIEIGERKHFYTNCKVCNGERKLTVNGITFKCPMCDKEEKCLTAFGYKVVRYRVHSIKTSMPNDEWKISDRRNTYYGLYHKHGKGYYSGNYSTTEKHESYFTDKYLNNAEITKYNYSNLIFSDYKLAVKCAEKLTEESINEIKEFNARKGTNFEIPNFCIEHDKKSK